MSWVCVGKTEVELGLRVHAVDRTRVMTRATSLVEWVGSQHSRMAALLPKQRRHEGVRLTSPTQPKTPPTPSRARLRTCHCPYTPLWCSHHHTTAHRFSAATPLACAAARYSTTSASAQHASSAPASTRRAARRTKPNPTAIESALNGTLPALRRSTQHTATQRNAPCVEGDVAAGRVRVCGPYVCTAAFTSAAACQEPFNDSWMAVRSTFC